MTEIVLMLKQRKSDERIEMSPDICKLSKDELYNRVQSANIVDTIHDKVWMEMIVNHIPEGGLTMTEVAAWFPLTSRLNELDTSKECELLLTVQDIDMIWKRLQDQNFKLQRTSYALVEFFLDLQKVVGRSLVK